MALIKSEIVTEVARRTERNERDVTDFEINAALQAITMEIPALQGECTTTTIAGRADYDLRSLGRNFKRLDAVRLDGDTKDECLNKIASFSQYQTLIDGETEADYDEPDSFIIWNDTLYLYPTPDDAFTMRLFSQFFERDSDNITLPDEYAEPLISLACFEVLSNKGLADSGEARGHFQKGMKWVNDFKKLSVQKIPATNVMYNDI